MTAARTTTERDYIFNDTILCYIQIHQNVHTTVFIPLSAHALISTHPQGFFFNSMRQIEYRKSTNVTQTSKLLPTFWSLLVFSVRTSGFKVSNQTCSDLRWLRTERIPLFIFLIF